MKYLIVFAFLVFASVLAASSKSLKNDFKESIDAQKAEDFVNYIFDEYNYMYTKIVTGLKRNPLRDYSLENFYEERRRWPIHHTRPAALNVIRCIFKYREYLKLNDLFYIETIEKATVGASFLQMENALSQIESGLLREGREEELKTVESNRLAIRNEILPVLGICYRDFESQNVKEYLNPEAKLPNFETNNPESKNVDELIRNSFKVMASDLKRIEEKLSKTNLYQELADVGLNRIMLSRDVNSFLKNSSHILFEYPQHWRNDNNFDLSFKSSFPDQETANRNLLELNRVLSNIKIGLEHDGLKEEALKISEYESAIYDDIIPTVKTYYELMDKFKNYLI